MKKLGHKVQFMSVPKDQSFLRSSGIRDESVHRSPGSRSVGVATERLVERLDSLNELSRLTLY